MAVYDWPSTAKIQSATIDIDRNQQAVTGASGFDQIIAKPGDKWVMNLTLAPMRPETARTFLGFLQSLRGRQNHFRMKHPDFQEISGTADGDTGAVMGGSQTGNSVIVDGFANGKTFLAGDILQFGSDGGNPKLKTNLFDATVSGGQVTLSVDPPIYSAFADNTEVQTRDQMGTFRLANPGQPISTDRVRNHFFTLAIEEVLP